MIRDCASFGGRADRVLEIAKLCYLDCHEAVGIVEFLEAGNSPEVSAAFEPGSGYVPNLITKAMTQRLLMSIMRMYDKPGSDRETLPRAFELLKHAEIFDAIRSRGDEVRLGAAIDRWKILENDPTLREMRSMRNYELAHNIPSMAGKATPRRMNVFRVVRETIVLVEDLAAGTGIVFVSLDHSTRQIWAKRATAYWHRLIGTVGSQTSKPSSRR
jgi:AbiU2